MKDAALPKLVRLRPASAETGNWPAIDRISIDGLFGRYSYPLLKLSGEAPQDRDIALFYGGNGTGKTTILKLIYAALSPETDSGLRSYLAATSFRRFSCHLRDGTIIEISKINGLVGDYEFRLEGKDQLQLQVSADQDLKVKAITNPNIKKIEDALARIGLDILFLHDNRRVQNTRGFLLPPPSLVYDSDERWYNDRHMVDEPPQYGGQEPALPLEYIVMSTYGWLRDRAARQGSTGESDASMALLQLMRSLGGPNASLDIPSKDDVLGKISALEEQATTYVSHGLMTEYPFAEIKDLVVNSSPQKFGSISSVLTPFLSSVAARMHALREVHGVISTFETEMNHYLRDKQVFVNVLEGIRFSDGRNKLDLDSLSSGERQLVFLFCAAVLSRGTNSIFLVDEPELSLNSKWQRGLVGSMSNLVRGARTQFVMATHSIEILARHRGSAIGLDARGPSPAIGQ